MKWKTKSGETMFIHEMTTEHLKNATNLMARNESSIAHQIMQEFEQFALTLNGDASTMWAESIINHFYNDEDYEHGLYHPEQEFDIMQYPAMEAMMKELKKRGVNHDPQFSNRNL